MCINKILNIDKENLQKTPLRSHRLYCRTVIIQRLSQIMWKSSDILGFWYDKCIWGFIVFFMLMSSFLIINVTCFNQPMSIWESGFNQPLVMQYPIGISKCVSNPYLGNLANSAYGYFSFCLISCIKDILRNRTNNFSVETSFHQFSNMASSGLKRMFILQHYIHKMVYQKIFS